VENKEKSVKKFLADPAPAGTPLETQESSPSQHRSISRTPMVYWQLMQGKSRQEQYGTLWWMAHALVQLDSEACYRTRAYL
jgi:hypothetical protein